jgi:SAM-dependent methyltransferase
MEAQNDIEKLAKRHVRVFKSCLPMQIVLNEISKAVGPITDQTCLEVGASNGMMSYHLRKMGGKWQTAVRDEQTAAVVKEFVGSDVKVVSGGELSFKKKAFDVVVVHDFLERVQEDDLFVEECHRILQPDGRIVIVVPNRKSWTLVNPLRKLLHFGPEDRGWLRPGYTESHLFSILKHGFDVHQMRSFGKVLVEITDTIVKSLRIRSKDKADPQTSQRRVLTVGGVFYKIAYQLDILLFVGRGFKIIATAKRRTWRPRNAPILVDGRSISEAVLSRPGV